MPPRKPPPTSEILDTLLHVEHGRLQSDRTALSWDDALHAVRYAFSTNLANAAKWLLDIVTMPDCPLIALRPYQGYLLTSDSESTAALTDEQFGWSQRAAAGLWFDRNGRQLSPRSKDSAMRSSYLVRRDQLSALHHAVTVWHAEIDREHSEKEAAETAEFRALHGDALDVIQAVIDQVPGAPYLRDDLIERRIHRTRNDLYADDAVLIIRLHGEQIDAFAALLGPSDSLKGREPDGDPDAPHA